MIRRIFNSLYFLTFLNGFLLATLFYFKMEANFEKELFNAVHANIDSQISKTDTQDSVLVKAMRSCHNLLVNQGAVFEGKIFEGLKSELIEPTSIDLMTAKGACGSFAMVLARVLQGYDFDVRIAQMKAGGVYGAHNIVEAKTKHGWVILDPLFNLYFVKPDQNLASFEEVKNNWPYYSKQLPANYDSKYDYEDVRYSNWTKIPVVLPATKYVLDKTIGKSAADGISIRTYFLRKYEILFNMALFFFLFVFAFTLVKLIKAKVFPQKNIPITFANIYKYLRLRLFDKSFTEHGQA